MESFYLGCIISLTVVGRGKLDQRRSVMDILFCALCFIVVNSSYVTICPLTYVEVS